MPSHIDYHFIHHPAARIERPAEGNTIVFADESDNGILKRLEHDGSLLPIGSSGSGGTDFLTTAEVRAGGFDNTKKAIYITDAGTNGGLFRRVGVSSKTDDGYMVITATGGVDYQRVLPDGRLDLRDFGAILDGDTDDTTALQAAYDLLPTYEAASDYPRTIYVKGILKFDPTAFVAGNKFVKIQVDGYLKPTETWVFDTGVWEFEGLGGALPTSYQKGICAGIVPPSATDFAIELRTSYGFTMRNFSISYGGGILMKNTVQPNGNIYFFNVGVVTSSTAEVALDIENVFWVWFDHCAFINSGPSGNKTIRVTSVNAGDGLAGLLNFSNCTTGGRGILFQQDDEAHFPGSIKFINHAHESLSGDSEDFFTSAGLGTYNGILFDNLINADALEGWTGYTFNVPYAENLRITNPTETYTFRGGFKSGDLNLVSNYSQNQQVFIKAGTRVSIDGEYIGADLGKAFNPTVRAIGYPITYSMPANSGTAGTVSFTPLATAFDGSPTAYQVAPASGATTGLSDTLLFYLSGPVYVNDWYVFGAMVRAVSDVLPVGDLNEGQILQFSLTGGSQGQLDSSVGKFVTPNSAQPVTRSARFMGAGWTHVYGYARVNTAGTGDLVMNMRTNGQNQYLTTKPYVRRIPAAMGFTETDIINYLRNGTALSGTAGNGVVTTANNAPFKPGEAFTSELPSPSEVGRVIMFDKTLNKLVYSNGTVWKTITTD